jgi:hypothetical protein
MQQIDRGKHTHTHTHTRKTKRCQPMLVGTGTKSPGALRSTSSHCNLGAQSNNSTYEAGWQSGPISDRFRWLGGERSGHGKRREKERGAEVPDAGGASLRFQA